MGKKKKDEFMEQEKRIEKVLGNAEQEVDDESLGDYWEFLEANLKLPCEAESMDDRPGAKFKVLQVTEWDDHYGVLAKVKDQTGQRGEWPLCDLECVDRKSPNHQMMDDYSVWFVNNR